MSERSASALGSRGGPASEFVARALLLTALVAALGSAFAGAAAVAIGGSWAFFVAYCALVALVSQWTTWFLTERLPQSFDRRPFRVAEIGAVVIIGVLVDALLAGADLGALLTIGPRAIIFAALILVVWFASVTSAGDFGRLGEPPERDPLYVPPLEALTRRFFVGGALLVATIGVATVGPARLLDGSRGNIGGPIIAALVYFPVGLALLALAQHTVLGRRWAAEGTTIVAGLGGRWARISLLFMALTMALAFILPTAYGIGLLDLLALVLRGLIWILALLGIGATAPLFLLLSRLGGGEGTTQTAPPPAAPPPPPPPVEQSGAAWVDVVRWIIFGILAAALAIWLLRGWLENRALLRGALGGGGIGGWLRGLIAAVLARLRGVAAAVGERFAARSRDTGRRPVAGSRLSRLLPARDPRSQVIRYYLSLLRRAETQGFGRGAGQTPREYAARLAPRVPGAGDDIAALTTDFTEARWSRHAITPERSGEARGRWERVRDALRRRQRADEESAPPED